MAYYRLSYILYMDGLLRELEASNLKLDNPMHADDITCITRHDLQNMLIIAQSHSNKLRFQKAIVISI